MTNDACATRIDPGSLDSLARLLGRSRPRHPGNPATRKLCIAPLALRALDPGRASSGRTGHPRARAGTPDLRPHPNLALDGAVDLDRKSTRLNSSHVALSR